MALRPIFISSIKDSSLVKEQLIEFDWSPGFSISQKQKSIDSLHRSALINGFPKVLEISSKSRALLGIQLSALNLKLKIDETIEGTIESIYQGSKVFEYGGPFTELYYLASREARKSEQLYNSGKLINFSLKDEIWGLLPESLFYDWLYVNALTQSKLLAEEIMEFDTFTDIEFNPQRQYSCQARSAALFVSLVKTEMLERYIESKGNLGTILVPKKRMIQETLDFTDCQQPSYSPK